MKTPRADYTLGFKKEAVRLVQGGQRQSEAASSPGSWIKADAAGRLAGRKAVKAVSDEQMEISRLKAELARTRMERDILKKATAYFARESRRDTPSSKNTGRSGRSRTNAACSRSAPAASGHGASAAAARPRRASVCPVRRCWPMSGLPSPPASKPPAGPACGGNCARKGSRSARSGFGRP